MKKLLFALPLLLAAGCESFPRFIVTGEDQTVTISGREWTVNQISTEPLYYRAVRETGDYFFFGPPARTKTSQAISALQTATGCRVIGSTLYKNVSDHFIAQMDCSANPEAATGKPHSWPPLP